MYRVLHPRVIAAAALQETPQGKTSANYVFFENTVYVQTPVNQVREG